MSVLTLRPNADGNVIQLGKTSGFPNYGCVNEGGGGDGDATIVICQYAGAYRYDLYQLDNTSASGVINKVTAYVRCRTSTADPSGKAKTVIKTNGSEHWGSELTPPTGYTLYNTQYALNPITGNPWTWAEINALQNGVALKSMPFDKDFDNAICTQAWIEVDYTPFPTQYSGLRIAKGGVVQELCLVAAGDGATGMGGIPKIRKGATTYDIYLVETGDSNASPVRIKTTTGIKAMRKKT